MIYCIKNLFKNLEEKFYKNTIIILLHYDIIYIFIYNNGKSISKKPKFIERK